MKFLLDTYLLLWAAAFPKRLPPMVCDIIDDAGNEIVSSVGSIWEVPSRTVSGGQTFRSIRAFFARAS